MIFFDAVSFLVLLLSFQYTAQIVSASGSPVYDNTTLSPITFLSSTTLPLASTAQFQSVKRPSSSASSSIGASPSKPAASLITSLSSSNLTGLTSTNVSAAAIHTIDVPGGGFKAACKGNLPPTSLSWPVGTRVKALPRGSTAGIGFTGPSTLYTTITGPLYPQLQPYVDLPDCCGQCRLYINLVDVFYWPVPGANSACLSGSTTITSQANLPSNGVRVRAESLVGNGSYAVGPDGYTYTSPSIYIAYHDVSASNFCGQLGAKHTSVTLALDPGEVSTLAGVPVHRAASPQSFNFADLPCPPQSLIDIQNADRGAYILPILPQYAPIIVAPSKLLNLDPAWKHCAQDEFIAFDPPKALTPVSALLPGTTTRTPIMDPTPAAPNSAPNGLPKETGSTMTKMVSSVKNIDPTKDQARTSEFDPTASIQPTKTVDPPLPSGPDQKSDGSQSISANGMASNGGSFKSTSISSNVDPQNPQDPNKQSEDHLQHAPSSASVDPSTTLAVQPGPQGATNAPVVVVQGHTISETSLAVVVAGSPASHPSGFAYVGSNAAPTPMPTLQPDRTPDPVVIGGLSFTPVAKVRGTVTVPAVMVQGQTLWEDGPSATIGGNNVVYSAGFIHVGTYAAPAPSSAPQQLQQASAPQVVNGLTFSPTTAASAQSGAPPITVAVQTASSGSNFEVIIGNHTALSDDSPITISGTPVSLGPAGLVVGKVTYTLPHSEGSGELPVATIDGQTIQFRPTGPIAVDGMSLSAGGPPITVSGIPISLGLSSLVIGTSVVPLPTTGNSGGLGEIILSGLGPVGPTPTSTSANSSNNVQNFTGSQAQVEIPSPAKLLFATAFLVALSIFM